MEAFRRIKRKKSAGVDGVTYAECAEELDGNLKGLYQRIRSGRYQAPPVRRVWLEKDDGSQRPIGIRALEDKILHRAVVMILEPIYEQLFYECSKGFRPRRSARQALEGTARKVQSPRGELDSGRRHTGILRQHRLEAPSGVHSPEGKRWNDPSFHWQMVECGSVGRRASDLP